MTHDKKRFNFTLFANFCYTLKHYQPGVIGPGFCSTSPNWVRSKTNENLGTTAATRRTRQPNLQIKWTKSINEHERQTSKFNLDLNSLLTVIETYHPVPRCCHLIMHFLFIYRIVMIILVYLALWWCFLSNETLVINGSD